MDKKTLTSLFVDYLFRIPDYQRGYAWEEKQLTDFIQDVDALAEDKLTNSHYTGTVVVYCPKSAPTLDYGTKSLPVADVVDGQQRLTTACLYLSVIIRALLQHEETAYASATPEYLYAGAVCKLTPGNHTTSLFFDLIKSGYPNAVPQLPHEKRMAAALARFQAHVDAQVGKRGAAAVGYLKELFKAVTQRLHFTFYTIEEESEIGMTFELMNSRGKGLSVLELLKNYLMHWVSRNADPATRSTLTTLINKSWSDAYRNLGECNGNEDQCLRVVWTLYCSHLPKHWEGYDSFKQDEYIPLRNFGKKTRDETEAFIHQFTDALAQVSGHYAAIISPSARNTSSEERRWLTKIHNTDNVANFLALLVAARMQVQAGHVTAAEYAVLLRALECFAYRVLLYNGRRSSAGKSSFYRWGSEILRRSQTIGSVIGWVYGLTRGYLSEKDFIKANAGIDDWYGDRRLLKYTLYEYELHLLEKEGQNQQPTLAWEDLSDATIEHILPQQPDKSSHWRNVWTPDEIKECLHDIGNLVLTRDNSSYSNFEFSRKKGAPGFSPSYSNSDIRQERRVARYADWTRHELVERRLELTGWMNDRWKTPGGDAADVAENEEENEDATA